MLHFNKNTVFDTIFSKVQSTDVWEEMGKTVENSPWHREESVQKHTEMVLNAYDTHFANGRTPRQQLLTKLALLFHDLGKPDAEETLQRDDGSNYRRYAGHELLSANFFNDFTATHKDVRRGLLREKIAVTEIRAVRFMIEHHLPYDFNDKKLALLKMNLIEMLGNDWIIFTDMVQSDSLGRISDDHEAKMQRVKEWVEKFNSLEPVMKATIDSHAPTMYVLVGTSGSGKSTFVAESALPSFSLDALRIDMFMVHAMDNDSPVFIPDGVSDMDVYKLAWDFCNVNAALFEKFASAAFTSYVRNRKDFVLDNMNTSKKGRRKFITQARQAGYKIVAVEFITPLDVVINRQQTRGDKSIPRQVVKSSYMKTQLPWLAAEYDHGAKRVLVDGSEIDEFKILYSF